jgi:hypothetical protein
LSHRVVLKNLFYCGEFDEILAAPSRSQRWLFFVTALAQVFCDSVLYATLPVLVNLVMSNWTNENSAMDMALPTFLPAGHSNAGTAELRGGKRRGLGVLSGEVSDIGRFRMPQFYGRASQRAH